MPTSAGEGKNEIITWVNELPGEFKRVLDLGVGKGTYSKLFRKYQSKLSDSYWIGVEAWAPYIEKFKLHKKYHQLINQDIRLLDYDSLKPIDITIAGDVLEHVTKDEAVTIVNKVLSISPYMVISIPIIHYPQGSIEGNPYEIHAKDDWSHAEVMETFPQIINYWGGQVVGCYLLSSKGN